MQRITDANLQAVVDRINQLKGLPLESYSKGQDGKHLPNPGVYHINGQNGGVSLATMSTVPGCTGIRTVFYTCTKRELYNQMQAFISGIYSEKKD